MIINNMFKDTKMTINKTLMTLTFAAALLIMGGQQAHATQEFTITIKNHIFSPESLEIPAGEKVKLIILNEDPTPEEFESYDLNREKIVTGNGKISIFVGPLKPGEYSFFGEFHEDTAKGKLIVR